MAWLSFTLLFTLLQRSWNWMGLIMVSCPLIAVLVTMTMVVSTLLGQPAAPLVPVLVTWSVGAVVKGTESLIAVGNSRWLRDKSSSEQSESDSKSSESGSDALLVSGSNPASPSLMDPELGRTPLPDEKVPRPVLAVLHER